MSHVSVVLLGRNTVIVVLLFLSFFLSASVGQDDSEKYRLILLRDDAHYTVKVPSLNFEDQSSEHEERLKIIREVSEELGFEYKGRAALNESAVLLRKASHLRALKDEASVARIYKGEALDFCKQLNDRLRSFGFEEASYCEHSPWKARELRNVAPDNLYSSDLSSRKVSLDYLIPDLLHSKFANPSGVYGKPLGVNHHVDSDATTDLRRKVKLKLGIHDPLFEKQWHLFNVDIPGHDLRVGVPWLQGINGEGVNVAVIDDGVDFSHPDLVDAEFSEGSIDLSPGISRIRDPIYAMHDIDKRANRKQAHGTRCAGEVAARINDTCGVGVAPGSKISSIKLIGDVSSVMDTHEASAISHMVEKNDIFTCSWGPVDNGMTVEGPGPLTRDAIAKNVQKGRNSLGSIYVFASGNGLRNGDDCNYDGYVNDVATITIASIDMYDRHPPYSEECPANLAVTYSSINRTDGAILTSDVGNDCNFQTGTSASAPIAAALYAMALQVRKNLSWRDVQQLTILSAIPVSLSDESWVRNAAGLLYSNRFGYGKLTAAHIVNVAKTLNNLRPQTSYTVPSDKILKTPLPIYLPYKSTKIKIDVDENEVRKSRLAGLEHAVITLSLEYPIRGMLEYYIISPSGTHSKLAAARGHDISVEGLDSWTFTTTALWGEKVGGKWEFIIAPTIPLINRKKFEKIRPAFRFNNKPRGIIKSLSITFLGEEGDPDNSTFAKNIVTANRLRGYSDYKITRNERDYSPYLYNEKYYERGYTPMNYQSHISPYTMLVLILAVMFVSLLLVSSFVYCMRRKRLNNDPGTMRIVDPNDPFGPHQGRPPESPTNYPLVGMPPPLSYNMSSKTSQHPYFLSTPPPSYAAAYGANEYQRLP